MIKRATAEYSSESHTYLRGLLGSRGGQLLSLRRLGGSPELVSFPPASRRHPGVVLT
jgi:hypothetical protein